MSHFTHNRHSTHRPAVKTCNRLLSSTNRKVRALQNRLRQKKSVVHFSQLVLQLDHITRRNFKQREVGRAGDYVLSLNRLIAHRFA